MTQAELKSILSYDPDTGVFLWLESRRGVTAGTVAGSTRHDGYQSIRVRRKSYLAHRLAWLYTHGEWPEKNIDHIDHDPSNNRVSNLRDVPQTVNNRNLKKVRDLPCGIRRGGKKFYAVVQHKGYHCSRRMPTVTMALLWLAALRAKYDPQEARG